MGLVGGYFGGLVDTLLARLMDVVLSFPFLLFAIALVSIVGPGLWISIVVIAFFSWASVGRVVRGQTLSLREREYVEAARSLGAGDLRIMFVDILPNLIAQVIVYLTLLIPAAVVFEATLSFLGLGVVPPTATWGNMLSDSLGYYRVAWWFVLFPGVGAADHDAGLQPARATACATRSTPAASGCSGGSALLSFLLRRVLLGITVLWAITTVVFVMFFVAPTHVAQLIAGRQATPETVALVSHRLGLDRPILTQYVHYLWRLLHGDLGYSYYNSTPVTTLISQRVGVTASLALGRGRDLAR